MSQLPTAPPTTPDSTADAAKPARKAGRRIKIVLVTLTALLLAAVLFSVAANAAVSAFAAHDHGTLEVSTDGERIDLDQPRFHDLHPEFHIHPGHGNLWHHHPRHLGALFDFEAMTLREALSAMGVELTGETIAFDGTVYDLTVPEASVTVQVGGITVDLDRHVITDGDDITVEVVSGR